MDEDSDIVWVHDACWDGLEVLTLGSAAAVDICAWCGKSGVRCKNMSAIWRKTLETRRKNEEE